MNREFKFRVWGKKECRFLDPEHVETGEYPNNCSGELLLDLQGRVRIAEYSIGNGDNSANSVFSPDASNNYVIQQFIGVKDKLGKGIYEGDIVKFEWSDCENSRVEHMGEVYFEDGVYYFSLMLRFAMNDANFIKESLEVIGNIFENP